MSRTLRCTLALAILLACTGTLIAQAPPRELDGKAFQHPDLQADDFLQDVRALPAKAAVDAQARLEALGAPGVHAVLDLRSDRFATLWLKEPIIAGRGVGNELPALKSNSDRGQDAWNAVRNYLVANQAALGIAADELSDAPRITVYSDDKIHIHVPRTIDGIPVHESYVKATVSQGNLILLGAHKWSDRGAASSDFLVSRETADLAAADHLGDAGKAWGKTTRTFLTLYNGNSPDHSQGYRYQAAWSVKTSVDGVNNYEVFVDARSGQVLAAENRTEFSDVVGGVYPVTNDGIVPDGVEQAGWPMPFADVGAETTSTGGVFLSTATVTTDFYGPYVDINDQCGAASLTGSIYLDWGTSGGTNCTTPGWGGPGNTHASRTGFYELNKIIEMGRGQLPSNSWLQQRLISNMNINNTCNAYWNGTVNFYRSGGGCFNTGEIAGVFDHEWGHGMDANDATPGIASPSGEGIADIYTALRLNDSCIGRNFRSTVCSGNGDPCLTCTGVRDIDYLKRQSGNPHGYSWSNANCGTSVHCKGGVYSEAVWSLWKRKLQSAPYNYDNNTAQEITTRLTYIGAGNTGTWFSGSVGQGGCAATNGYQNYLAADDDNGNLNDGTPHMTAIYESFNDQEIACSTPTVQDAGCAGVPTTAPAVNATPSNHTVGLSWGTVAGATSYEVFRTEGVFQCDFGKVRLGETAGTTWSDTDLQNGREYSYVVIPKRGAACFGPASSCVNVAPASGPGLTIDTDSASSSFSGGDGDAYLDNCENGTTTFDITNTGLGSLTNVNIVSVTPSNAGVTMGATSVTPSSLAEGATAVGSFSYTAGGLTAGEDLTFTVEVSANEMAGSTFADITISSTETDLTFAPSTTYSFESGTDGWTTLQGTFVRENGGGAGGTTWFEQSSANLDNQCDQIQSPAMVFSATTTLSLSNNYDIEPQYTNGVWYDRANVGLVVDGSRSAVNPDSGRLYNASGSQGTCGTTGQDGWADTASTWAASNFSAGALGSAGLAGQEVRLDVRYGTDGSLNGTGFRFDEVTVTDVYFLGPDAQSDSCGCVVNADCDDGLFCNGAEVCNAGTCEAGTAPNCDDGVSCTVDSCNEGTNSCDNTPSNALCDDGAWCNGAETCDPVLDCQPGTPPSCPFGCNEAGDVCYECAVDADCDDGLFCNGAETCSGGTCLAGTDPCPGQTCDEQANVCVPSGAVRAEWGTVTVGVDWQVVPLNNTFTSPVVVTAIQYANNTVPVVTRVAGVTGSSFEIRLQAAAERIPEAENVSYLVVEEGAWTIGGVSFEAFKYTSTVTDENNSWVGEAQSYQQSYTNPVVLGQVMSYNDARWSVFWTQGATRASPPSASALRTGKTVCEDIVVTRADETVGVVVFESAHGTLGGVEFESALGADTVRGVGNTPPYSYDFNTAFAGAPSVGLVTMAGVDGVNGGWAQVHGATMATAATLNLSIDEDAIGDAERSHTTEQVGYVVFATSGSASD